MESDCYTEKLQEWGRIVAVLLMESIVNVVVYIINVVIYIINVVNYRFGRDRKKFPTLLSGLTVWSNCIMGLKAVGMIRP